MSHAELVNKVRISTYEGTIRTGRVPKMAEVASDLGVSREEVRAAYRILEQSHAFIVDHDADELWRAAPFSAVPTAFPVHVGELEYFGNCIWDALGIPAAMHKNAVLPASCGCCNHPMTLVVRDGRLELAEGLIHFAVPPKQWYNDVAFT